MDNKYPWFNFFLLTIKLIFDTIKLLPGYVNTEHTQGVYGNFSNRYFFMHGPPALVRQESWGLLFLKIIKIFKIVVDKIKKLCYNINIVEIKIKKYGGIKYEEIKQKNTRHDNRKGFFWNT